MKIVHVCLCGSFGEEYAYQDNLLPKYHRRLGHEVTIIAPTYGTINPTNGHLKEEPFGTKFLAEGVKLIRLRPVLPQAINKRLHLFRGLYKELESENPELIFVHGLDSLSYLAVNHYWNKHKDVCVVFDNHSDFNNSYHSKLSWLWLKFVNNPLVTRPSLKYCQVYYGVTPARCSFLKEAFDIPQERIKLLPFGADDDSLRNDLRDKHRVEVRQTFGISSDDFLIVTGGKIDKRKNIHILADAISRLKNPKIKLLVFGEVSSDLKSFFDNLDSSNILCIGWIPSDAVYQYFHAADLVFFPGLHSVMWEQAVASRIPCVFTKIEGFEHVNYNGNAILLDTISVDSIQQVVVELFHDSHKYQEMKVSADSEESERFVYSKIAKQVLDDIRVL